MIKNFNKKMSALVFLCILSYQVNAELYLGVGYEGGGEVIVDTNGSDLNTGSGVVLNIGVESAFGTDNRIRITFGLLKDSVDAYSGASLYNFETSATVIEASLLTALKEHSFGIGFSMHKSPDFKVSVNGTSAKLKFDDTSGFFALYEYQLSSGLIVGARYTIMDYTTNGETGDANSFGMNMSMLF